MFRLRKFWNMWTISTNIWRRKISYTFLRIQGGGNADETGIDYNPVPDKVLVKKGSKNVYWVETAKPKERLSIRYTYTASGLMLTPQLILRESISNIVDISYACGGNVYKICAVLNKTASQIRSFFRGQHEVCYQPHPKRLSNPRVLLWICNNSSSWRAK